jgi:gamma-glutamylcyclotransferase (GGCT)/AIG2-like uncharacterized protein YtfP
MKSVYLFVYGTLRSDCGAAQAELILQHFTLVGSGSVQGQLYEIDGYPGLVLSTDSRHATKGELYQLTGSAAVLEQLDEYEGCTPANPKPHEYRRREVPVKLQHGGDLLAWVYLYNWPLSSRKRLEEGDYATACSDCGPN